MVQKDAVTNILRRSHGLEPLPPKHRKLQKFEKELIGARNFGYKIFHCKYGVLRGV